MTAAVRVRRLQKPGDVASAEALLEAELAGRRQARRGDLMDPLEGDGLDAGITTSRAKATIGSIRGLR